MLTSLWTALPQAEKAKYVREAEQNLQNLQKSGNRGEVPRDVVLGQGRSPGAPEISPDIPTGPSTSSLSYEEVDRSQESQAYKIFYSELRQVKDNV